MSKLMNTNTFTALVTPFKENGAIDYASLDSLIAEQVQAGNGLVLLGSTGENLSLTKEEKLYLLSHVCEQKLPLPILTGVGGIQLEETLDFLRACEALAIDGYLMVSPIYTRPGPHGQLNWFRQLLNAVSKPCMLYNVPARTGSKLAVNVLKDLSEHPNLWALKEASGSLEDFRAYRNAAPEIALFSGNDDLMPILASQGAVGLVSVMGNPWPEATNCYVQRSLQKEAVNLPVSAIRSVNNKNPVSAKILLHALGKIRSPQLRAPLSIQDGTASEELLECHISIEQWLQGSRQTVLNPGCV